MNMLNALSAYGVQQKESTAKPLTNPDAAAKTAQTSFAEAIQYTDETQLKQQQTSDIYSKNGMGDEQEAQVQKEEGTEAEQNQERLDNVSGRMTEEDMAELQKEGFSVGEMTVEQLEAAMERNSRGCPEGERGGGSQRARKARCEDGNAHGRPRGRRTGGRA